MNYSAWIIYVKMDVYINKGKKYLPSLLRNSISNEVTFPLNYTELLHHGMAKKQVTEPC